MLEVGQLVAHNRGQFVVVELLDQRARDHNDPAVGVDTHRQRTLIIDHNDLVADQHRAMPNKRNLSQHLLSRFGPPDTRTHDARQHHCPDQGRPAEPPPARYQSADHTGAGGS